MKKHSWWITLALPLAIACGQEGAEPASESATVETPPAAATTEEVAGIGESSTDLSPVTAQMAIDDVEIGHALTPEGRIDTGAGGDDFAPGHTIYLAMEVGDTPAGSAVKVVWYGPNETKLGEQTATVAQGQTYLNFQQTDTAGWAKGDYRAEVWIGDEKVNQQEFNITEPENAGA